MKQRILSILMLAALVAMVTAVAFSQTVPISGTFSGTINGKPGTAVISGTLTLAPATQPTPAPVAVTPATKPTTAPVVITSTVATPATLPIPPPVDVPATLAGRPSKDSAGIARGVALRSSAGVKIVPGGVYDRYDFGQTTVRLAAGQIVKFTNCRFSGGTYGINANGNAGRILIDHCEFIGQASAGIYGDGFEATNNFVHRSAGDGFKPGRDVLLQGNYVTDLGYNSPDAHADGVQIRGGQNIRIIGNFFDLAAGKSSDGTGTVKGNAGIFCQTASGKACSGIVAQGNWIKSPNSGIHAHPTDAATSTQTLMTIDGNVIDAKPGLEIHDGAGVKTLGNLRTNGTKIAG